MCFFFLSDWVVDPCTRVKHAQCISHEAKNHWTSRSLRGNYYNWMRSCEDCSSHSPPQSNSIRYQHALRRGCLKAVTAKSLASLHSSPTLTSPRPLGSCCSAAVGRPLVALQKTIAQKASSVTSLANKYVSNPTGPVSQHTISPSRTAVQSTTSRSQIENVDGAKS